MRGKVRLTIGVDNFRTLREKEFYFVDKSLFIEELLEEGDVATLITRPRRFGKTLIMSMVSEFFDITKDSRAIFEGLAIMDTKYAEQMNSRPVIYLTLKGCARESWEMMLENFIALLFENYVQWGKTLSIPEESVDDTLLCFIRMRSLLREYCTLKPNQLQSWMYGDIALSLQILTRTISEHFGKKVLVLIDEVDSPILAAREDKFEAHLGGFFNTFLGETLKGNKSLDMALLTGIEHIASESFNNLAVYTESDECYSQYFGFTTEEATKLLQDCGVELNSDFSQRYDKYRFGNVEIFNPWELLNYARIKIGSTAISHAIDPHLSHKN